MINKKVGAWLALPIAGIFSIAVWALDTRYVTISDLKQFAQDQQYLDTKQQVRELRLKKRLNMADAYEEALLEELERDLE